MGPASETRGPPTGASEPPHFDNTSTRSYWWDLVVFKVQDKVYRVPRHAFIKYSGVFETMFSLPQDGSSKAEGKTEEKPISLPGCTKDEFESLLGFLYPPPLVQTFSLKKEDWSNILKLSTLWDTDQVRAVAMDAISKMNIPAIEKAQLARRHHIPEFLLDAYSTIITTWGSNSMNLDVIGAKLGWETAARLASLAMQTRPLAGEMTIHRVVCQNCNRWDQGDVDFPSTSDYEPGSPVDVWNHKCPGCKKSNHSSIMSLKYTAPPSYIPHRDLEKAIKKVFHEEFDSMS